MLKLPEKHAGMDQPADGLKRFAKYKHNILAQQAQVSGKLILVSLVSDGRRLKIQSRVTVCVGDK